VGNLQRKHLSKISNGIVRGKFAIDTKNLVILISYDYFSDEFWFVGNPSLILIDLRMDFEFFNRPSEIRFFNVIFFFIIVQILKKYLRMSH